LASADSLLLIVVDREPRVVRRGRQRPAATNQADFYLSDVISAQWKMD
jgi:hypothetical protein